MAPAAPAAASTIQPASQGHVQLPLDVHLRIVVASMPGAAPVEGVLESISFDSMTIQAPVVPPTGARVTLSFRMLRNRFFEARGHVVRQGDGSFVVAVDERSQNLDSFLRDLSKLHGALRQLYLADVIQPRIDIITSV